MLTSAGRARRALLASVIVALGGCGAFDLRGPLPAGARQWIIEVVNDGLRPVELAVAEDVGDHGGRLVGTARPDRVGPGMTIDVEFTVPAGTDWAIFVDPALNAPLILATDVPPDVRGELPITIHVGADGSSSVSAPDRPGWFGT